MAGVAPAAAAAERPAAAGIVTPTGEAVHPRQNPNETAGCGKSRQVLAGSAWQAPVRQVNLHELRW